jgi:hypothetical protein
MTIEVETLTLLNVDLSERELDAWVLPYTIATILTLYGNIDRQGLRMNIHLQL